MLWPWSSSAQKLDLSSSCFPVWLKLKHVPLELLTKEGLSYLASTLGTPLHTDRDCSKLFNNDCANVCVKVEFLKPLLHELKLDLNGEIVTIDVIYSWKPLFCDVCKNWGHHELACPSKKAVKKWIPKAISNDLASVSNNAAVDLKACPSKSSVIDVQSAVPTMQHTSVQPTDSVQKQQASSTDVVNHYSTTSSDPIQTDSVSLLSDPNEVSDSVSESLIPSIAPVLIPQTTKPQQPAKPRPRRGRVVRGLPNQVYE
ncbi:hypothetical protein Tsubulata_021980 [Turnera subulata]|uniref:DUF4283 domain-containing protein n=1 Tax=Turnera subulata TaxID=218843 RepID=A0A9Q0JA04_9ROSI|nr:hypothetical protein Tsubulata_021980 [Turnera subulata]